MRYCKKCNNELPHRVEVNGIVKFLAHRKYCFECSPYKQPKQSSRPYRDIICTICSNTYKYRSGHGVSTKCCYSCSAYIRRAKLKNRMIEYKGGKCEACGYNKCNKALQFHHIDRSEKEINLLASLANNHKWEKIQEELDKCKLLCANCHIEIEVEIYKSKSVRSELVQ